MIDPQNQNRVVLTSAEVKAKFEELDMLTSLRQTCHSKKIPRSTKTRTDRRYTAEHGEIFIRKTDGENQAILFWWRLVTGDEEYSVEQFTGPDGTFYSTDTLTHPSNV